MVTITAVHEYDAYYPVRNQIIGLIGDFTDAVKTVLTAEGEWYYAGDFACEDQPVIDGHIPGTDFSFYAIRVEERSDERG